MADHINSLFPRSVMTPNYVGAARFAPKTDAHFEPWTVLGHLAMRNRIGWPVWPAAGVYAFFSMVDRRKRLQRRRDDWDEQRIGHMQHVLRQQRNARRTVKKDHVVFVAERLSQLANPAGRPLRVVELQIHVGGS